MDVEPSRVAPSAIILAAGESSRFWPLSAYQHKSLFVLGGVSLLERTVRSLTGIGVREIVVVQSPRVGGQVLPQDVLPSEYGPATVRFVEQPTPAGQGDAIARCADLVDGWFFVVQPENVNAGDIGLELLSARRSDDVAVVAGQRRPDFALYAVLEHVDGRLNSIVEKPATSREPEPLCSMGVYLFHREFLGFLASAEPGPLSIIQAIGAVARSGAAGVVDSRHQFLPLKFPGHLWAYARWLGLTGPADGRRIVGDGCVLGEVSVDNAIFGPGCVVGSGTRTVGSGDWDDLDCVVIGPGATIGANVRLFARARVGAGATIGSGAEVTGDVPDGATVAGSAPTSQRVPAKVPGSAAVTQR